jgi:hypothetical protein
MVVPRFHEVPYDEILNKLFPRNLMRYVCLILHFLGTIRTSDCSPAPI